MRPRCFAWIAALCLLAPAALALVGCQAGYVYELQVEPLPPGEEPSPRRADARRLTPYNLSRTVDEFVTPEGFHRGGSWDDRNPPSEWQRDTDQLTGVDSSLKLELLDRDGGLSILLTSIATSDEYPFARQIRIGLERAIERDYRAKVTSKLKERTTSN